MTHSATCGAGVGIFLRIRDCEIVLLNTINRGSIMLAPFLDKWGENDKQLKRGHPLYLNKIQYRQIQTLWLEHGLHREISNYLKIQSFPNSVSWKHY